MTSQKEIDPKLVDAYRQRRAPPAFASRVALRAPSPVRRHSLVWRGAAVAGVVASAALLYLLAPTPMGPPTQEMAVPPAPDYWAEISVPQDPPVSGLSDFGTIPLFPARPDFDTDTSRSNHRSTGPRRRSTRLSRSTHQEINHEAV
jgi:hypothetical protein